MFEALSLVIDINIDPNITTLGGFTLTWHGLFSAVGIIAGVWLGVRLAAKNGIPAETGQEIAIFAVIAAIIGARLFYVLEHFDNFSSEPWRAVTDFTEGGITLYGGLIGGVVGGLVYGIIRKLPLVVGLDAGAPAMLLGQGIGRIGDTINGEHLATHSDLPWAFRYTHPNTLGELGAPVHPTAGGYELLGDFLIMGLLLYLFFRVVKQPGYIFALYLVLYGCMRFFLSEFRLDERMVGPLSTAQITSAVLIVLGAALFFVFRRWPGPIPAEYRQRVWGEQPPAEKKGRSTARPAR